jgi:hypothetical protein
LLMSSQIKGCPLIVPLECTVLVPSLHHGGSLVAGMQPKSAALVTIRGKIEPENTC